MDEERPGRLHHVAFQRQVGFQGFTQFGVVFFVVVHQRTDFRGAKIITGDIFANLVGHIIQSAVLEIKTPAGIVCDRAVFQSDGGLPVSHVKLGEIMDFIAQTYFEQSLPQQVGDIADDLRGGIIAGGLVDDDDDAVVIKKGVTGGHLGFDVAESAGAEGGGHIRVIGNQFEDQVLIVIAPAQEAKQTGDFVFIGDGLIQDLFADFFRVSAHAAPENIPAFDGSQDDFGQVFDGHEIPRFDQTLKLIHADTALIMLPVPEIHIKNAVAPLIGGKDVSVTGFQRVQILFVNLKAVDGIQRDHGPAVSGIDHPFQHSLHPVGTGQHIKVAVVDEKRVLEDVLTGFQHILQRRVAEQSFLKRQIPGGVLQEKIGGEIIDTADVCVLGQYDIRGTGGQKTRFRFSDDDQGNILKGGKQRINLKSPQNVDAADGGGGTVAVMTYGFQGGTVSGGEKSQKFIMIFEGIGKNLHVQQKAFLFA